MIVKNRWDELSQGDKDNRFAFQRVAEEEMFLTSRTRYWKEYNRAPDEGIPEQKVLDFVVEELSPLYQEWIDLVCSNTKTPSWVYPLLVIGADKMADVTIRSLMRIWLTPSLFGYRYADLNKPPTAQALANQIASDVLNIIGFERAKEEYKDDWKAQSKFIKNWTAKRCIAFAKKVYAIPKMTLKQRQDFGHHMIRIAEQSAVIVSHKKRERTKKGYRNYLYVELSEDILKDLHKQHYLLELTSLLYRPMITPPVDHTLNYSGGHLLPEIRKPVVQKYKSNLYVEDVLQEGSEPSQLVLDGLNGMQKTEWCINERVYTTMDTLFINNTLLANLPAYSFDEFVFTAEFPVDGTKVEQAQWCQHKEESWGAWYKQEQARGRMLVRMDLVKKLLKWGFFYMPYTLDFRGRAYSVCELLSPQSSDVDRGLLQFGSPMKQTPEGLYAMKVYLANLFGEDKCSLDDRVAWVDDRMDIWERIQEDPHSDYFWVDDAKKKNKSFQRLSVILDITRKDKMTQVPCHIDGKCNGSQHWSALLLDKTIAGLSNVSPSDIPQDLYQYVADKTSAYIEHHKDDNDLLLMFSDHWNQTIDRAILKRPTMCDSYGLTFYGIQKYVKIEGHVDWVPKERRGGAVVELSRAIQAGLNETLKSPNEGKEYLKEIAGEAADNNKQLVWTTPSGFKVVHTYNVLGSRRSLAKLFNHKELKFYFKSKDVDIRAVSQAIAPNYIHSLDAAHMFLTIFRLLCEEFTHLSMIHDSYGCYAPLVGRMRTIIREEFIKMHSENLLEKFQGEIQNLIGKVLPDPPKRGLLDINLVRFSDYFFS